MIRHPIDWRGVANDLALLSAAMLMVVGAWVVVVFLLAAEVPQ